MKSKTAKEIIELSQLNERLQDKNANGNLFNEWEKTVKELLEYLSETKAFGAGLGEVAGLSKIKESVAGIINMPNSLKQFFNAIATSINSTVSNPTVSNSTPKPNSTQNSTPTYIPDEGVYTALAR